MSDDFPLAMAFVNARTLRLADGPDEVHRGMVARLELRQVRDEDPRHRRRLGPRRGADPRLAARGDEVLATDLGRRDGVDLDASTSPADDDWAAALVEVEQTRWGGLDILVNNAGVAGGGRLDVATLDEWRWITEINLFGAVRGTRTFVPLFKRQRSGHIVNVASLAGLVHPAGMASYNAVKAAVVALTETTGHELAAYGVRASVVCPSYFRTNLMDSMQGADTALAGVMAHLVESSPLTADDIAAAVHRRRRRRRRADRPRPAGRATPGSSSSTTGRRTTR